MLATMVRIAYEANEGIVYGSTLVALLYPLIGKYIPPNLASSLSSLNLFIYLESYITPILSHFGVFGNTVLSVGVTLTLTTLYRLASQFLNISSQQQQGLTIVIASLITQFVFGGWSTFSIFLTSLMFGATPPVPGLSIVLSFIEPFVGVVISTLGALMTIFTILYELSEAGILTLP